MTIGLDPSEEGEQDAFAGRGCFAFSIIVFWAGLVMLGLMLAGVWVLLQWGMELGL
jgi:hypothetical protein